MNKWFLFILTFVFCSVILHSQNNPNYPRDLIQIKTYSIAKFKNSKLDTVKVTKVFCDYCSENQLNALKQEAWNRAYYERYNPKNRLVNGKRKLALYIRISKKDFLNLKEVEDNTTN